MNAKKAKWDRRTDQLTDRPSDGQSGLKSRVHATDTKKNRKREGKKKKKNEKEKNICE